MEAVVTEYLNDVRASGRSRETVKQYRWHLARWLAWCREQGAASFDRLTKANLRAWAAGIRDDWAPATCRTAVVSVKGFLRWAADNGYCAAGLAGSLTTPKRQRRGGAVAMIEAGAPSRVVQMHGGWDNLEMVEWYTQQADAAKVFDRWSPLNGVKKGGEPEQ